MPVPMAGSINFGNDPFEQALLNACFSAEDGIDAIDKCKGRIFIALVVSVKALSYTVTVATPV